MSQQSHPHILDATPLPQPVDVVDTLLQQVGSLQFGEHQQAERMQALETYRRLLRLRGRVRLQTQDPLVLYTVGRALVEPAFAAELVDAAEAVAAVHRGETPPATPVGRSIAELAADDTTPDVE